MTVSSRNVGDLMPLDSARCSISIDPTTGDSAVLASDLVDSGLGEPTVGPSSAFRSASDDAALAGGESGRGASIMMDSVRDCSTLDESIFGGSVLGGSVLGGSEGRFFAIRAEFRTGGSKGIMPGKGKSARASSSSKSDCRLPIESGLLAMLACTADDLELDFTE